MLDKFFLKYEGGSNWHPPEKTSLKKPSLIRVKSPSNLESCFPTIWKTRLLLIHIEGFS